MNLNRFIKSCSILFVLLFTCAPLFSQKTPEEKHNYNASFDCLNKNQNDEKLDCLNHLLEQTTSDNYIKRGYIYFNLASVYQSIDLKLAIHNFKKSSKEFSAGQHPDDVSMYVESSAIAALINMDLGNYQEAEKLLLDLKINVKDKLDNNNNNKAQMVLHNAFFNLYDTMGRKEKAIKSAEKALELAKIVFEPNSPSVAVKYSNLGQAFLSNKEYDKAEEKLIKAYELLKKVYPTHHPTILIDQYNLGDFYVKTNKYANAFSYFNEGINVLEAIGDSTSIDYYYFVFGRSRVYLKTDEKEKAYIDIKQCLKLCQPLFPNATIQSMHLELLAAEVALDLKNPKQANDHLNRILKNYLDLYKNNSAILTEEELLNFNRLNSSIISKSVACILSNSENLSNLNDLIYNIHLMQKGLGLEREIEIKKSIDQSEKQKILYTHWLEAKKSLDQSYLNSADQSIIKKKEATLSELKKSLFVNQINEELFDFNYDVEAIRKNLPQNSVAIEFGKFESPSTSEAAKNKNESSIIYYALILNKKEENTRIVKLFEEVEISNRLDENIEKREKYVNQLYNFSTRGIRADYTDKNLKELILDPLLPYLKDVKNIYYAPEGLLHRINLGAIAMDEEYVFNDEFNLYQLGSTRNIVQKNTQTNYNKIATLFGGLNFDNENDIVIQSRGNSSRAKWENLKYSKNEIESIAKKITDYGYKPKSFMLNEGTETALRQLSKSEQSSRILHFATHGFFLSQEEKSDNVFKKIKNPMMRSGLVLAGGNSGWLGTGTDSEKDNILTASEIAHLNLNSTELVILSACETGLGDITNAEGVFGLQRAFKLAGAKYIIMSLWQIPDRETSVFMNTFYENWLNLDLSIADAFNKTQKEMRDRFFNPFQWAGFVLVE